MIAYTKIEQDVYKISLVDEEFGEVLEELTLSTQDEYETWKTSAINSGTTIEELKRPVGDSSATASGPMSIEASPAMPEIPQTEEQLSTFKSQLEESNTFYGAGDADLPTETPAIEQPTQIEEEDQGEPQKRKRDQKTKDNNKSSLDKGDFDKRNKELSERGDNSGLLNSALYEPVPEFKQCQGDVVLGGKNNQWLVFGRDRPGGYTTGYGPGEGDTQAGAIDLVVGRMSPHVKSKNRDGSTVKVSPIFNYALHEGNQVCDASRIYISQKTDIDSNFNLVSGRIGKVSARAGIALKSDGIRIIARDSGIKLVTHSRQLMNSQGGKSSRAPSGIDIIAGNDDANLQPMVLGDNLVLVLREYGEVINQIVGTVTSLIENVAKLDVALSTHFHPQAFPSGVPNLPSPNLAPVTAESLARLVSLDTFSTYAEKFKLEKIDKLYLSSGGLQSIRSSFNNVN